MGKAKGSIFSKIDQNQKEALKPMSQSFACQVWFFGICALKNDCWCGCRPFRWGVRVWFIDPALEAGASLKHRGSNPLPTAKPGGVCTHTNSR